MVEYETSELLDKHNLNVKRRKSKKTQIFLYDTGRRIDDYLAKLRYRNNEKYEDVPHYVVTKTGKIIKIFNSNHYSKTFGNTTIDRGMVKIALENLGWLNKNTITGVLHNWIGDPYRVEPYIKKWRDYYFWDQYPEEQLKSVVQLCQGICEEHNIPYQTVPGQGYISKVRKFTGIVCKSNFLNIYTDINPSFNFNIFYKDEYKETTE